MGQFDFLKNPAIFDALDNPFARVAGAKKNLGMATLFGVLSNFAQNKKYAVAPIQDTYLNNFVQSTPQYLKDYSNAQIDRSTRGVVSNVLASNPLNRAANTIAVADAQAANAKANLAVNEDKRDIGLRNAYLQAKQRRLDQFGAATADAENRMTQNSNTQIANYGALGTNYANEMQKAVGNEWAAYDRNKLLKSTGINALANYLSLFRNSNGNGNGNGNNTQYPQNDALGILGQQPDGTPMRTKYGEMQLNTAGIPTINSGKVRYGDNQYSDFYGGDNQSPYDKNLDMQIPRGDSRMFDSGIIPPIAGLPSQVGGIQDILKRRKKYLTVQ